MAADNANEPDVLAVHFKGTEYGDTLKRINLLHENITLQSQPVPNLGELFTTHPLNRGNEEVLGVTFPSIRYRTSPRLVKCRVRSSSGDHEFFFKLLMHVGPGQNTLKSEAMDELFYEARFYSQHLSDFQGDIVPRHYGLYSGKTTWGGEIVCAVMDNFPGCPWLYYQHEPGNNLESQRIVADAVVRLHDAGINHGELFGGSEHHILYHEDTKCVNLVGFKNSGARHHCRPSETTPDEVASSKELCGAMFFVAGILDLWYHDRLLKFDEENDPSKKIIEV